MIFTLTIKCPQCDGITSHCTDTSLVKDRVEYQGVRCHRCVRRTRANGLKRPTPRKPSRVDSLGIGSGNGMKNGKQRQAVLTGRYIGIR